jgi:Ca2+-binding RTX toxin-like protein
MMRSAFSRQCRARAGKRRGRERGCSLRRLAASVEGLEQRSLMAGGAVVLSGDVVTVIPPPTGPTTTMVSYADVGGAVMVDVNLNGADHCFSPAAVGLVYYVGTLGSGPQTFENETGLDTVAWGGSGPNTFIGGSGQDVFYGGSGPNTFDAGTGDDFLVGGSGPNVFNEQVGGCGLILEAGSENTVEGPAGAAAGYAIV